MTFFLSARVEIVIIDGFNLSKFESIPLSRFAIGDEVGCKTGPSPRQLFPQSELAVWALAIQDVLLDILVDNQCYLKAYVNIWRDD